MSFFKKLFGKKDTSEKSKGGSTIYKYTEIENAGFEPPGGVDHIDEISDHISKNVGEVYKVLHELISETIHIDIHVVLPTEERPYFVLVTSGMSDKPMHPPKGAEDLKYAELCLLLPAGWPIDVEADNVEKKIFEDENGYWPVRMMKFAARFPHYFNSWLSYGHTLPNGEEAAPYADNTKQGCILLWPSYTLPSGFHKLQTKDGKEILFFCMLPIYKEEMNYKLENGTDALFDLFEKYGVSDAIEPNRINVCSNPN